MKKKIAFFCILLISGLTVFAQTREIKGKVINEEGSPLEGVNIVASGNRTGVQTDKEGNFSITVTGDPDITVSYVGYQPKIIKAGTSGNVNVTLERQAASNEEVVVIGYQSVKRRDLVNSVSSITAKDIKDVPINNTAEALAGRLAGVQITRSEGSPDAGAVIRVRGGGSITQDNSPLYVVDGIQVENALSVLAPQDIQSIDVLKDASATSIYGARGANGVVIITTKSGRISRPIVTYNGLMGVRYLANKLEVLQPYDFVTYWHERAAQGGQTALNNFYNTYGFYEDLDLYKQAPFVDWQEQNMGRNAMMQTHNISLTGGTATTKYNVSLTSNKEDGVLRNSDFDRKLTNIKLDQNIGTKAKAGVSFRYNYTTINGAGTSNPGSSSLNQLRQSVKYRPILMGDQDVLDYDPDYANSTNGNSLSLVNPLLLNDGTYRQRLNRTMNISGYVSYDFNKFLSFKSTLGFDITDSRLNSFDDTITSNAIQNFKMPIASIFTSNSVTLNNSNVLTFTMNKSGTKFSDRHNLEVLLGHEVYEIEQKQQNTVMRYFPVGITAKAALANMGLASVPVGGSQLPPTSAEQTARLLSFFGRINYSLDDKYLAMFTVRADGSSKFATGRQWGYFPSGSFAWRVSKEKFMENINAISDLKLRLSYGQAGNNRIDNFLYLSQFVANSSSNQTNAFYSIGSTIIPVLIPDALANGLLTWETSISRNLGFDLGLWKNRLQLSADFYYNSAENLLINVTIPQTSGYTNQIQNVGETSNRGVEIQLNAIAIAKKDFNWTSSFNISFNKNKIENLGKYQKSFLISSGWAGGNTPSDYIAKVGQPVGTIWGLITDGFYTVDDFNYAGGTYTLKTGVATNIGITSVTPQPGALRFKDISGPDGKPDGVIDENDRTLIGNTQPKFFGGWNNQFTYKNFDLSIFINFQYGNDVYNANKLEFTSGYTPNSNMLAIMNGRWRNVNDQGQLVTDPAALTALNANAKLWSPLTTASSFYAHSWAIEDGSFLRINNITLGYNVPSSLLQKIKISNFRIYATVNNLAVFTNYSGYDPEVNTRRGTPLTPGVDYSAYPRSKAFIVGLNLSL